MKTGHILTPAEPCTSALYRAFAEHQESRSAQAEMPANAIDVTRPVRLRLWEYDAGIPTQKSDG